jgi:GNAT superfamily N-acetyltransferase
VAPLDFRLATVADARRLAELHVRAWRAAYHGLLPATLLAAQSVERRERQWREWPESQPVRPLWLVEREGALLGFAATGPSRDGDAPDGTGEVYAIYLDPAVIGTGVGRVLFAHVTGALRGLGFTHSTLWVLESNARARRFYEAAGWRADGTRKVETLHGHQVIEVRYACPLSSPS